MSVQIKWARRGERISMRSIQRRIGSSQEVGERTREGKDKIAMARLGAKERAGFGERDAGMGKPAPYRVDLANQVIGDVGLCGDDGVAIEFIQQGVHDPIQQIDGALVAVGAVAVQVVAIEDGIANPH
jgi:hypothetical protein